MDILLHQHEEKFCLIKLLIRRTTLCHARIVPGRNNSVKLQRVSPVKFAVRDMARAVEFCQKLGFEPFYGGADSTFSSLRAGEAVVNLATTSAYEGGWWGRVIFRVDDVDEYYRELVEKGLVTESPRDAPWGERFFYVNDPDGHELRFAEVLGKGRPD